MIIKESRLVPQIFEIILEELFLRIQERNLSSKDQRINQVVKRDTYLFQLKQEVGLKFVDNREMIKNIFLE